MPSSRPPFDPRRIRPQTQDPTLFGTGKADDGPATLTVSQLTRAVRAAIARDLPDELHVVGELSNVSCPRGGHCYFTLKDDASEVRCVMWRSDARNLKFDLADGLEVIATGRVDVYEPRGQYQLYVRRLDPRGVGALELAFRQLREKLAKEGLFDPAHKQPLPTFPRRIAIVTSPTGAAIRDICQTIGRRFPAVTLLIYGVRVQGEGAAAEIADAIARINRSRDALGGIDVMIVGRGGGSLEDLWAFNEEIVARAIYASRIPVVSAVGHEVDISIADLVADVRAATPTAAAELVVPAMIDVRAGLDQIARRLAQAIRRRLEIARTRLQLVERCELFRDPIGRIRRHHQQVDEVLGRLHLAVARGVSRRQTVLHDLQIRLSHVRPEALLARRRERLIQLEHRLRWAQGHANLLAERRLEAVAARLGAASPMHLVHRRRVLLAQLGTRLSHAQRQQLAADRRTVEALAARLEAGSHARILRRGFTLTRRERTGKMVRSPRDVREGERIVTETAEGEFTSRVVDPHQGELFDAPAPSETRHDPNADCDHGKAK